MNPTPEAVPARRKGAARATVLRHVYDVLRDAIRMGVLPADSRLVEFRLTRALGVSRGVLREALQALAEEGLVTREAARGTTVSPEPYVASADRLLQADDEAAGGRLRLEVVGDEAVTLDPVVRAALGVGHERLHLLEVLTLIDDRPVCLTSCYLPPEIRWTDAVLRYNPSLPASFGEWTGQRYGGARTRVEAARSDPGTAALLDVAEGGHILLRRQELWDAGQRLMIPGFLRYRSDRVVFSV